MNIDKIAGEYHRTQYAMYLRKSRADIELESMGEEETLARHKRMLEGLAAKHDISMNQITVYHEIVSGDSIDERPEMQRLLSDVYQKTYAGVLVVEVERLARGNTKDQGEVADAFQTSHTQIITPMKIYNPDNEFDQEYFEFGLFMSRREYKTIKRRLEAGKKASVMEGNYILPQRIFGYNIERKSKKDRILVANPDEAKLVQMMFDWYTEEGRSFRWIAGKLTDMGIPTPQNRPEWAYATIRDMMSNIHYTGKVSWNETRMVKVFDEEKGKLVKKRTKSNVEIYEGKHDAIISDEQFEKAQARKATTKPPVKLDVELKSPVAGLLVCKDCGLVLTIWCPASCPSSRHATSDRFIHTNRKLCKKKSLPTVVVMDAIIEGLNAYIEDYEIKMTTDNTQAELVRHHEVVSAMEKELANQESRKRKLMDSWEAEDGMYTKDEFIERKNMYTKTIDKLKEQIHEAKKALPEPVDYKEQIVNIHAMIDCIRNPELDAKSKNDFLKQFIDKITYDVIDYGRSKGGKPIIEVFLK